MTWPNLLLAVHILAAVIWVGGLFFALLVLRPSLAVLEPGQRLALHGQVFSRFFRVVWHVMPIALVTGYIMLFAVYGGFGYTSWNVHVMNLFGLIMAAVFLYIWIGPWRDLRRALAGGQNEAAVTSIGTLRKLVTVNLVLGLLTVFVAALNG